VQGLRRAVDAGARIWVPPVERPLIADVHRHWLERPIDDDYELLQDRFSLLEPVPVTGAVAEYRAQRYGAHDIYTLPTPGHTVGSVTYLVTVDGTRLAFSGDLLYGEGKVWSLAATQWTYSDVDGQRASYLSLGVLGERDPDVLLPSHGEPITEARRAIESTQQRLQQLMTMRARDPWDLDLRLARPWDELMPRLLRNRTSMANSFALISESGAALVIDFGYDLWSGHPITAERWARRPLLYSIEALRRDHGVERVEAVVMTHYHDDHVAGINLLREIEGTEVWAPANVAPVLEDPRRYDLPCLWFDPIPVDRTLALEQPVRWHEHELTALPLPGHTLYAAALFFEADGRRVLVTGDQQTSEEPPVLNYQYRNRFRFDDYVASAELYRTLRPDLILSGHWTAKEVDDAFLDDLLVQGLRLAELHRALLPTEEVDLGAEGFAARIEPYRATVRTGETLQLAVTVRNPFDRAEVATIRLVLPDGWTARPACHEVHIAEGDETLVRFEVSASGGPVRRARVAADVTVGDVRLGQQAEALVTVE
jgi:glyoxylase-like metal-dependent hydrolase (beta-lactamase superfamily II)